MQPQVPDKFVTIEEMAKVFAVSISTARSWVRQGVIAKNTYIKVGNTYRFNLPRVIEYLSQEMTKEQEERDQDDAHAVQLELDLDPDQDA